jgi:glycosyltransferase involved in cell wall biosynthesis
MTISVIMMTLHKAKYLVFAVASVMEFEDVELVLVSPSEKDESRSLFQSISEMYGRRVKFVLKPDFSPSEGLNNGLAETTGDIIGILNGDDFYLPGALKFVNQTFKENPKLDLFLGGGLIIDEEIHLVKYVIPANISSALKFQNHPGAFTFLHQSMFYRKSSFPRLLFNKENRVNWDTEFLYEILKLSPEIFESQKMLAAFRISSGNLSTYISKNLRDNLRLKQGFHGVFEFNKIFAHFLRIRKFFRLITWIVINNSTRESYRRNK